MEFNANQMREDSLIPEGVYKFKVIDATEKTSQAGNPMISLKLELLVNNRKVNIWDRLILIPKMFWKIEHFCSSTGKDDLIEKGSIMAQDCLWAEGYAEVTHQQNGPKMTIDAQVNNYVIPVDLPKNETKDSFDDQDITF